MNIEPSENDKRKEEQATSLKKGSKYRGFRSQFLPDLYVIGLKEFRVNKSNSDLHEKIGQFSQKLEDILLILVSMKNQERKCFLINNYQYQSFPMQKNLGTLQPVFQYLAFQYISLNLQILKNKEILEKLNN